jgi:plasmid stabilization system protein ParE
VNTPLRVEITENAQAQISAAAEWWAKNRPAAPDAIRDELDRILALLRLQPAIGTMARRATLSGIRRVTLSRIRYYVYYRVAEDALQVLAFWHASRGSEPPI